MTDLDLDRLGDLWRQRPTPSEMESLRRTAEAVQRKARWGQWLDYGAAIVVALLLWRPLDVYSAAGLEAVAVGIAFVWLTTLVRTLAALAPDASRPSTRRSLRVSPRDTRRGGRADSTSVAVRGKVGA